MASFVGLLPQRMRVMQEEGDFTRRLMAMEEAKTLPFEDIWAEYCRRQNVAADASWYDTVIAYEKTVLEARK